MGDGGRAELLHHADFIALRWLLAELWSERIKYQSDPHAEAERLAAWSCDGFEAAATAGSVGEGGHAIMLAALDRLESFWREMAERFPPGTPPAELLLPGMQDWEEQGTPEADEPG